MTTTWYRGSDNYFFILFLALMLLAIIGPGLGAILGDVGYLVVDGSLFLALFVTLWGIRFSPRVFSIGVALVTINALSLIATVINESATAEVLSNLSALLFLTMCALVASYDVFRRDRIDLHKVVGGLCIYLLIGIIWAFLFQILEQIEPSSFSGLAPSSDKDMRWSMLYFSFVTLTTLGYGDISPANIFSQTLVSLEAILGQFYLAVLVAGLVGSYLSDRDRVDMSD